MASTKADAASPIAKIQHDDDIGPLDAAPTLSGGLLPPLTVSSDLDKAVQDAADELSHTGLPTETSRNTFNADGALDSPSGTGQRNVQFSTVNTGDYKNADRRNSVDTPETPGKTKGPSFMSKLMSLTSPTGSQHPRNTDQHPDTSAAASPSHEGKHRLAETLDEEQYDVDADIDDTADEAAPAAVATPGRKKRRMRRFIKGEMQTPFSPGHSRHGSEPFISRDRFLRRRASMPDGSEHNEVMSEGEGKDHRRRPFARRGHSWMHAAPADDDDDGAETSNAVSRRQGPGHVRRITVFGGGGVSDGDAMTPRRPFFNSELRAASTYGVAKWKQVKSTLKLLRQKKEDRFDYFKSAELMAELRAGAPAALMLASMIQRDEHGNKRIPVLLEQLKLRIKDSSPMPDDEKERHWSFTMELEYGSGPSRMIWTVTRTIKDIYNLHFRYRFALNNDKYMLGRDMGGRPKQPKFPYSAFPYLRGARDKDESSEEEVQDSVREDDSDDDANHHVDGINEEDIHHDEHEGNGEPSTPAHEEVGSPHRHQRKRSRVGMLGIRRRSVGNPEDDDAAGEEDKEAMRQRYVEKQRRILEKYLSEMIRWLMFRADSNRLCRFLELSALGVRLAAEGSYHGKEGYLHIQSSKGLDFRRVLTPAKVIARHSRKWFLVRQSYIVCVESPENMNIYDVYLVDSKFSIVSKRNPLKQIRSKSKTSEIDLTAEPATEKHHTLTLKTSERKVRLFSRNQSVMKQFEESMAEMLRETVWNKPQRFESFAPVRTGVFAQWLVDGRDYMWNVSRAINMAKDVIYIHDWWLTPELYMRRPAAISQKWRLDRLLQKKAREGVKIFVIIYRNVEAAIPIDSEHTKFSLLNLHPNIFVQRSPNQFKKNQFFFAHHEKICVVDHDVAFVGGIDLCFGRWDCPQHPIADDKPTGFEVTEQPRDMEHCQLFPGKDYSNPRVQDFFRLNEPYEEMYDRSKVPRMAWHDISMQVVGQPARDLTRHFVQRWNYLRRGRKSTRPLPFLLPPPDAKFEELEALGLTGTCEVQILRSASNWSLGIEETEHSIQTAYVKMIEDSEHFVYIENQFFITSTEAYGTKIVNRIGDAIVERIIRAHENKENWRAVILIPLMPGFQNTVDEQEGTSVRLIIMCQLRSICRGEESVFGRLRAAGIEPEQYIDFFSLRQWGVMSTDALVTEQLYIHAKAMIVDDRVALIGSANINERSMVGSRDSECAAIVRDTDMIWTTMGGKPYQVGRFAHSLRLRLMREHLGLDTDQILEEEREAEFEQETFDQRLDEIYSADPIADNARTGGTRVANASSKVPVGDGRDSVVVAGREVLVHDIATEGHGSVDHPEQGSKTTPKQPTDTAANKPSNPDLPPAPGPASGTPDAPKSHALPTVPIADDTDIGGPPMHIDPTTGLPVSGAFHPMAADIRLAEIHKDCMIDPLVPGFMEDVWNRVARNNTKLYRRVFRCMPDSEVKTWSDYREFIDYGKRFKESMDERAPDDLGLNSEPNGHKPSTGGSIGVAVPNVDALAEATGAKPEEAVEKIIIPGETDVENEKQESSTPGDKERIPQPVNGEVNGADEVAVDTTTEAPPLDANKSTVRERKTTFSATEKPKDISGTVTANESVKRRRRATTRGSKRWSTSEEMPNRAEAEELLKMVQGNLVQFPYDWLITEDQNGNWGYQVDGVAPLAIYN
ncbi:Putative Phospholipase D [[Torrubiella] hemipterigena]|uniref:Phospholipase n=1 Tax=[Torrubiella] hemipterigena TaxID=1531966 RepID=A0A0A1T6E4_9HYPO|nr:Putative Phospholipase D [[Torrubiella] hemipterigena]